MRYLNGEWVPYVAGDPYGEFLPQPTGQYDPNEQDTILMVFETLLREATKDGGEKRARGEKPPWWKDGSHEQAIYSHLAKWKANELVDKDSGAHPLVHLAWRALAIAYQETRGRVAP